MQLISMEVLLEINTEIRNSQRNEFKNSVIRRVMNFTQKGCGNRLIFVGTELQIIELLW